MINGLGVVGWGVGGIEAEAAMLGQPITMLIPQVIGFKLTGKLAAGATATDFVLTVTQMLRKKGVVGKFVEFYGAGVSALPLTDRATSPIWLPNTERPSASSPSTPRRSTTCASPGARRSTSISSRPTAKNKGSFTLLNRQNRSSPTRSSSILSSVEPCLAGPARPQDRVLLKDMKSLNPKYRQRRAQGARRRRQAAGQRCSHAGGSELRTDQRPVVIAAITSCTNTSNPSVLMAAGLLAKKAIEMGLDTKPWVKTSLAPGCQVVTDYPPKRG